MAPPPEFNPVGILFSSGRSVRRDELCSLDGIHSIEVVDLLVLDPDAFEVQGRDRIVQSSPVALRAPLSFRQRECRWRTALPRLLARLASITEKRLPAPFGHDELCRIRHDAALLQQQPQLLPRLRRDQHCATTFCLG